MNNEPEHPENHTADDANNGCSDAAFDNVLHVWGAARTSTPDHLAEQKAKAIALVPDVDGEPTSGATGPNVKGLGQVATKDSAPVFGIPSWCWGLAGLLLLAVGISWSLSGSSGSLGTLSRVVPDSNKTLPGGGLDASGLTLVSTNLAHQQTVLQGFRDVYGDRLRSVSDVDGSLQVDLHDDSIDELDAGGPVPDYVSIRLVLISRRSELQQGAWETVHDVTMLAGQEHRVDLPAVDNRPSCSVWTHLVDDKMVSVDLQFNFGAPIHVRQSTSMLLEIGKPKWLFTVNQGGAEYRLYQTVDRINPSPQNGVGILDSLPDKALVEASL